MSQKTLKEEIQERERLRKEEARYRDLESASKEAYLKNKERVGSLESEIEELRSTVSALENELNETRSELNETRSELNNFFAWAKEFEQWRDTFEDWAAEIQRDADGPGYKSRESKESFYSDLGLSPGASAEEIKRAYRDLAKQHHPDKGGDAKMFQKIQTAYDNLMEAA